MTAVQRVAQIFGIVFILIAIAGFIVPGGTGMEHDPEIAPKILGLFPTNLLHNIVHLAFGVWGLVASRSFDGARSYARISGVIYLVLAALAFVDPTTFGLIPIGGNDVWLHALLGIVLAVVGFTAKPMVSAPVTV